MREYKDSVFVDFVVDAVVTYVDSSDPVWQ